MRKAFLLTMLCLFYAIQTAFAQPIVLKAGGDLMVIGKSIEYLEDKDNNLSIQDILNPAYQNKFQEGNKDIFVHVATKSAYWFKITVSNQTMQDVWMDINTSYAWYLDFYAPDINGEISELPKLTGTLRDISSKAFPANTFWLPLNKAGETSPKTFYFKIKTSAPLEVPILVGTINSLSINKDINDFLTAGFLGWMLIMFLYNLFLGISTKDRLYFYYIAYIFFFALASTHANNYSIFELLPYRSWWYYRISILFAAPIASIGIFSLQYLSLKKNYPFFYYLIILEIVVTVGVSALNFILPESILSILFTIQVLQIVTAIFYVTLLTVSYYLLYKKEKTARLYALAWTFMFSSVLLFLGVVNGLIDYTPFTRNVLYYGASFEVWMFSLALGSRYNFLQKEQKIIQTALLEKVQEELRTKEALLEKQSQIDQMKAEQQAAKILLEQREILRGSIDNLPVFVAMMDKDGKYLVVNKLYEKSFGGSVLDFEGKHYKDIPSAETLGWRDALIERAQAGEDVEFTEWIALPNGNNFYAHGRYTPVFDTDGSVKYLTVFVTDISQITEKEQRLEALNATKDKLFSIIAHDLRSPLTTLTTLVSLFKDGMLEAEDIYPMMEELAKNMNYTTNLVDNLLYWAAAQLKGEQLSPKFIDLRDLIKRNSLLFEEQLKNKEIELEISFQTEETQIYVDKDMIDLVLRNLLSNALKYTDRGGRIGITVGKQSDQYLEICVADNGLGMHKEQLEKLFFENIKSLRGTEDEKGTGLGLILCKDFIEKNGGRIWVESELGKGTTFYFTVPSKAG